MRVGNRASPALLTSPQSWRRSTVRSQIARAHPVKLTGPAGRSSVVEQASRVATVVLHSSDSACS